MSALKFSGPVLPDGEPRDLYVVDGRVTYEPVASAELVAEGWIVPGLVDAHCHIGLDEQGGVPEDVQEEQAIANRDVGALLLRDCGTPPDTAWIHDRDDLPRLIRAGRHLARPKRYIRNYAHEIEPDELPAYVAQEADRGDGWVKLVGDWIDRATADLAPAWDVAVMAAAVDAAHKAGARVAVHTFAEESVAALVRAGVDSVEHGTGLAPEDIDEMARRGTALVPTMINVATFGGIAARAEDRFPAYAAHMLALRDRQPDVVRSAHEAGVPIYVGTDAGGGITHGMAAREMLLLHERAGMAPADALRAASWGAREWLGFPGLVEGGLADLVVYDADPREDLRVVQAPARIILRGRVVR
jgi:imidazolonepropionase-like amidohydrolase